MPDRLDPQMKATTNRPRCVQCDRLLKIARHSAGGDLRGAHGDGVFCTLTCGYQYGLRAATEGVEFQP